MKRFGLLCAFFILVSGIVFAAEKTTTVEKKEFGITMQIPEDWKVDTENYPDPSELWLQVPVGDEVRLVCYFRPLTGDYAKSKKDLAASFRNECFADYNEQLEGGRKLIIKVVKKSTCSKTKGKKIEVCTAEFKYDFQRATVNTCYAIFKTEKGAYMVFFSSSDIKTYKKHVDKFKKVLSSIQLMK